MAVFSVKQEKSGGKIIRRSKSMLYVFRGRNYNWNTRPQIPLMLWKPPAPIYPPVVQSVPEGLSVEEADNLRALGRRIHCLCRLSKNASSVHIIEIAFLEVTTLNCGFCEIDYSHCNLNMY